MGTWSGSYDFVGTYKAYPYMSYHIFCIYCKQAYDSNAKFPLFLIKDKCYACSKCIKEKEATDPYWGLGLMSFVEPSDT